MKQNLSIYNKEYYKRDISEYWLSKHNLLRPDQLAAVCYTFGINPFNGEAHYREPGLIYSIGCGAGDLENTLEKMGYKVVGVDPSHEAQELYKGDKIISKYTGGGDTIIFCESIEHIPHEEIKRIMDLIPKEARVIIVNWPDFHPIPATDDEHITEIDDVFLDRLSDGRRVVFRRESHLVLEGDRK